VRKDSEKCDETEESNTRRVVKAEHIEKSISKGKAVPLRSWSGPEGTKKLRFPHYMTTAQDGGKVVSLTHRPPLPPENAPGTHFC
jgi:hypothetical protein